MYQTACLWVCSDLTQGHGGTRCTQTEAKAGVDSLGELGLKGGDVFPLARRDPVVGHRAGGPVQEHAHPLRGRRGRRRRRPAYQRAPLAVTGGVVVGAAVQGPGLVVAAQAALVAILFPGDSLVGDTDRDHACPLHLPVAAAV